MFKPSSLLTVLVSVGLAAPISSFASGACVNPDFRAQKISAVKTSAPQKAAASETPASKESNAPSVPLIAGQADELKIAADNFKTRYPKTKVLAYRLTPLAGIFEATVGKEVIYFDKTARFVFSGRLLDMDRGEDLTDKRLKDLRRIAFDSLPLESIHPEARVKSDAVWCAKDPSKALSSALKGEPMLKAIADNPVCPSPVNDVLALAKQHGIGGTPTLINEAGDRSAGALPLDKLEAFINAPLQGN